MENQENKVSKPYVLLVKNTSEESEDVVLFDHSGKLNSKYILIESGIQTVSVLELFTQLCEQPATIARTLVINVSNQNIEDPFANEEKHIVIHTENKEGIGSGNIVHVTLDPYQQQTDRFVFDDEYEINEKTY